MILYCGYAAYCSYTAAGAVKEGIVKGYPDNTFKPDNEVTRGEVFALIANCID